MYLNLGLDSSILNGVLDNDVAKHNKYLYGASLEVFPVTTLTNFKKPLILCDMGAYDDEIRKQINQNYPHANIL